MRPLFGDRCEACKNAECGKCRYCVDKPKFGGPNKLKKGCVQRRCTQQQVRGHYVNNHVGDNTNFRKQLWNQYLRYWLVKIES